MALKFPSSITSDLEFQKTIDYNNNFGMFNSYLYGISEIFNFATKSYAQLLNTKSPSGFRQTICPVL